MNHTPILYAIGLISLGLATAAHIKAPVKQMIVQPVQHATSSGKINPYAWGELTQGEVDRLQKELEAIPKMPVVIFCSDDNCKDIVLDFDNAFESAHWTTDIQRPLLDESKGIWTSSREIAAAIDRATNGRLKASLLGPEWKNPDKIALAIGRKRR